MKKLTYSWASIALASFIFLPAWGGGNSEILAKAASTAETAAGAGPADMASSFAHSFAHMPAPSPASSSTSFPQASRDTSFVPEASGFGDPFASRKKSCVVGIKPGSATQHAQDVLIGKHHDDWKTSVEARCDSDGVKFDDTDAAVSKSTCSAMVWSVVMIDHKSEALAMIAASGNGWNA